MFSTVVLQFYGQTIGCIREHSKEDDSVRDCNIYVHGAPVCDAWCSCVLCMVLLVCDVYLKCLCAGKASEANKLFFAGQDIYLLAFGVKDVRHGAERYKIQPAIIGRPLLLIAQWVLS